MVLALGTVVASKYKYFLGSLYLSPTERRPRNSVWTEFRGMFYFRTSELPSELAFNSPNSSEFRKEKLTESAVIRGIPGTEFRVSVNL